jgi:ApbE superfamily uncharacterized protein (UPF0280 family)
MRDSIGQKTKKYHLNIIYRYSKIDISTDLEDAEPLVREILDRCYISLEKIEQLNPDWQKSFEPVISGYQDPVILRMEEAAKYTNVGPMAAIAGAIADLIAEKLIEKGAKHVVVENGGEIAIKTNEDTNIALLSLTSFIENKFGLAIPGNNQYLGIASSSGTFGHAISLGTADLVTIFAKNAAYADAAATAITNEVIGKDPDEAIQRGIKKFTELDQNLFFGVIINKNEKIGVCGKIPPIIKIKNPKS